RPPRLASQQCAGHLAARFLWLHSGPLRILPARTRCRVDPPGHLSHMTGYSPIVDLSRQRPTDLGHLPLDPCLVVLKGGEAFSEELTEANCTRVPSGAC